MSDPDKHMSDSHRVALDARDWIVRLTSGSMSDAELEQFKRWRDCRPEHRAAFDRERAFWNRLDGLEGVGLRTPARKAAPTATRRMFLGGAAAAGVIGVMAAPRLQFWLEADYIVPTGSQTDLPLPDGSRAMLNTGSAIKIDYRDNLRLVHLLRGEAEFQIVPSNHGPAFRVAAGGGNTDSQGGQLSIGTGDDRTTVAVIDGEAAVFNPASPDISDLSSLKLVGVGKTQQTSYQPGLPPQPAGPADLEMLLAWRQGKIIFEGRAFAAAINEIGRYIAEPIILRPGINRQIAISGIFSTRDPLVALQSVARTQSLSVRRIPGVAIVIA